MGRTGATVADLTPAATLRAAATLIRETASHALGTDRPWRYAPGVPSDSVRTEAGSEIAYGDDIGSLRWIALMSPDKAEALAAWLEDEAEGMTIFDPSEHEHLFGHPLACARTILGRTP